MTAANTGPARWFMAFCLALPGAGAMAATLHEQVVALYSFAPHELDKEAINAKSLELDRFWEGVKAQGPGGLGDLRAELQRGDASPFFHYDGAKLLMSLSKARDDVRLALQSIALADLRDLQWNDYFFTVHALAVDGLDTTDAAFKILGQPKFQAYVPQHALTLDQDMCLAYLLLPTDEAFYLHRAEERLSTETDVVAIKSLLSLLADTVTKSGDEAIARFAATPDRPAEALTLARQIIEATGQMSHAPVIGMSLKSYSALKREQRELFARVSDEAIYTWERVRVRLRNRGYR
jgi:hypothetical protein